MLHDFLERLHEIDKLIRAGQTGGPKNLAKTVGLHERNLYTYLSLMRDLGAPIAYDKKIKSYYYKEDCKLTIKFVLNKKSPSAQNPLRKE